ncbi:MAG: hypothetical protein KDK71_09815, partial [Chlamydiia bacterium]|nr:hypothetical protein [Chlamydiia bacterium]
QIREEMDKLRKSHPKDSLICALQDAASAQATSIVDSNVDFCLEKIERPPWMTLSEVFRGLQFKVIQHMAPTIRNWMIYAGKITEDALEGFMWTGKRDCELSKVIGSRILTIWFIAEAFRYPPMMFYSMLLLHLFVNNELTEEELNEALHPSEGSTEKAQFYCYVRETENFKECTCPHNQKYIRSNESRYGETIDEMEARKTWLLQKLQKSIRKNIDKYGHPEEECVALSATVFKALISKYLTICIGEKTLEDHPVDLDELLKFSLRSGGQLAPIG